MRSTTVSRLLTGVLVAGLAGVAVPPGSAAPAAATTYRRVSGPTFQPRQTAVSGNGRYVAFVASPRAWGVGASDGLVPPPVPAPPARSRAKDDVDQVWVADRVTGRVELVSVSMHGRVGNFESSHPSLSADGRFVVFASMADNLVPGDVNTSGKVSPGHYIWGWDIFVRDRLLRRTTRVSLDVLGRPAEHGASFYPVISADGSTIAFFSMFDLASRKPGANGGGSGMAVYAVSRVRGPGSIQLASRAPDGRVIAVQELQQTFSPPAISADGRYIASISSWPDAKVYVRDLKARRTVILPSTPAMLSEGTSTGGSRVKQVTGPVTMDAAGTKVAFEEEAWIAGHFTDDQRRRRVLLWSFRAGGVQQVDGADATVTDPTGTTGPKSDPGAAHVTESALSGNGRYLVFTRADSQSVVPLGPVSAEWLLHDSTPGVPAVPRRVFLRDLVTGRTSEVVTCDPLPAEAAAACADRWSHAPSISFDGSVVAFVTTGALDATDPDGPTQTDRDVNRVLNPEDVYVRG